MPCSVRSFLPDLRSRIDHLPGLRCAQVSGLGDQPVQRLQHPRLHASSRHRFSNRRNHLRPEVCERLQILFGIGHKLPRLCCGLLLRLKHLHNLRCWLRKPRRPSSSHRYHLMYCGFLQRQLRVLWIISLRMSRMQEGLQAGFPRKRMRPVLRRHWQSCRHIRSTRRYILRYRVCGWLRDLR